MYTQTELTVVHEENPRNVGVLMSKIQHEFGGTTCFCVKVTVT